MRLMIPRGTRTPSVAWHITDWGDRHEMRLVRLPKPPDRVCFRRAETMPSAEPMIVHDVLFCAVPGCHAWASNDVGDMPKDDPHVARFERYAREAAAAGHPIPTPR